MSQTRLIRHPFTGDLNTNELEYRDLVQPTEAAYLESVTEIYCLEMSEHLLTVIAPSVMEYLEARTEKITRILGDFSQLQFGDAEFDYVIYDSAASSFQIQARTLVTGQV